MSTDRRRVTPERAAFLVSVAILVALALAIVFLWVRQRDPVTLTVHQVGAVRVAGELRYVTADVRNTGDETAQAVQVVAELVVDGEVLADRAQLVDFLPGGEVETVVFIFDRTPPDADVELRAGSYQVP